MGDPSQYVYRNYLLGAAADLEVTTCPFRPSRIEFYVDAGASGAVGYKSDQMAGDDYFSTVAGMDDGVTITDNGFELANGADINIAAANIHYVCHG